MNATCNKRAHFCNSVGGGGVRTLSTFFVLFSRQGQADTTLLKRTVGANKMQGYFYYFG
jgi:hypothetical protein